MDEQPEVQESTIEEQLNPETSKPTKLNKNGKPNLNNGIHLTETCEEWNEALTHKDFMACCDLMSNVMRNFS